MAILCEKNNKSSKEQSMALSMLVVLFIEIKIWYIQKKNKIGMD